jgi:hypothetical protein
LSGWAKAFSYILHSLTLFVCSMWWKFIFCNCIEKAVDVLVLWQSNCNSFSLQRLESRRNLRVAMQFVTVVSEFFYTWHYKWGRLILFTELI